MDVLVSLRTIFKIDVFSLNYQVLYLIIFLDQTFTYHSFSTKYEVANSLCEHEPMPFLSHPHLPTLTNYLHIPYKKII